MDRRSRTLRRSGRAGALRRWLSLAAVTAIVAACGSAPRVDGIPIGEQIDCGGRTCDAEIAFARSWLDAAAPGHAPVRQVEIHAADFRNANGEHILLARSGGPTVAAVLRLEDGTIRAVLVGCGIGINPDTCMVIEPPANASGRSSAGRDPVSVAGFRTPRVPSEPMIHLPTRPSTVPGTVAATAA